MYTMASGSLLEGDEQLDWPNSWLLEHVWNIAMHKLYIFSVLKKHNSLPLEQYSLNLLLPT